MAEHETEEALRRLSEEAEAHERRRWVTPNDPADDHEAEARRA